MQAGSGRQGVVRRGGMDGDPLGGVEHEARLGAEAGSCKRHIECTGHVAGRERGDAAHVEHGQAVGGGERLQLAGPRHPGAAVEPDDALQVRRLGRRDR